MKASVSARLSAVVSEYPSGLCLHVASICHLASWQLHI